MYPSSTLPGLKRKRDRLMNLVWSSTMLAGGAAILNWSVPDMIVALYFELGLIVFVGLPLTALCVCRSWGERVLWTIIYAGLVVWLGQDVFVAAGESVVRFVTGETVTRSADVWRVLRDISVQTPSLWGLAVLTFIFAVREGFSLRQSADRTRKSDLKYQLLRDEIAYDVMPGLAGLTLGLTLFARDGDPWLALIGVLGVRAAITVFTMARMEWDNLMRWAHSPPT